MPSRAVARNLGGDRRDDRYRRALRVAGYLMGEREGPFFLLFWIEDPHAAYGPPPHTRGRAYAPRTSEHLQADAPPCVHLGVLRGRAPDLRLDDGAVLVFNDPRRFGFMDLFPASTMARHPRLAELGPEPLSDGFSPAYLDVALKGKRTPVKAALLDQEIVAGLGNIYVCEALWRAGISPRRMAATIPGRRAQRLVASVRSVLQDAIRAGGSSLRDFVQASGELGYFQHSWQVYDRAGQPCGFDGCAGGIRRIVQSGRSTFYCAKHQR